jgi:hypothetical protein
LKIFLSAEYLRRYLRTIPASARVLEKAGFVFEGCLKNNVIKDGKLLDSLLYAKTR